MRLGLLAALAGLSAVMMLGPPAAAEDQPLAAAPQADHPAVKLTLEQLDSLTAPIALYPDTLIAQILMAATYPLEVVEAARWLKRPGNAALAGDQLADALTQERWDPSVKSLVAFPHILRMMDDNLTWTEQLGDAFLAAQSEVMDSVQRLRQKAEAAGKLQSTPHEVVTKDDGVIGIKPPEPNRVYVPVYDPNTAYGTWPYPDYPPADISGYFPGATTGSFGFGWFDVVVVEPLCCSVIVDFRHHRIDLDAHRFNALNTHRPPIASGAAWQHDPWHRGGVPFRDAAVGGRFPGAATVERFHGAQAVGRVAPTPPAWSNFSATSLSGGSIAPLSPPQIVRPSAAAAGRAPAVLRPAPSVVPSFGHTVAGRTQIQGTHVGRGFAPAPVFAPAPAAVAPRAMAPAAGVGAHK